MRNIWRVVAGLCVVLAGSPLEAQDAWVRLAQAQYQQVWSGQGTLVYSVRHPGRDKLIELTVSDYDPTTQEYFPEEGPDTVEVAFDRRSNMVRIDDTKSTLFSPGGPWGGQVLREVRSYVWNGQELKGVTVTQTQSSSGEPDGVLSSTPARLPMRRTPEFPLMSLPREGFLPEIVMDDALETVHSVVAVGEDGKEVVRRIRVVIDSQEELFDIDQRQGFTLVRREVPVVASLPGVTTIITIVNREYERNTWYPSQWTMKMVHGDTDEVLSTASLTVLRFAVNIEIPPDHFALAFPAGTNVNDERESVRYVQPAERVSKEYAEAIRRDLLAVREGRGHPVRVLAGLFGVAILVAVIVAAVVLLRLSVRKRAEMER